MKYAIVGAGFTGLAAAYDLIRSGHQVTLFEAAPIAGGLASGFKEPHWSWSLEKYYHHWFASDQAVKKLLTETALISNLLYFRPKTAVYYQGNFYPLDSPLALLSFTGLNLPDKLRFGYVTAQLKYLSRWPHLEKYTAVPWLKKHYGLSVYQLIWEPLLKGKFGPHYQQVNMAWMWARLKARTPSLGTYRGGFQACLDDLVAILKKHGVNFYFNLPINRISQSSSGFVLTSPSHTFTFDAVLLTTPPKVTKKMAPLLPDNYLNQLIKLPYLSALVLILALKYPLSPTGIYWHNLPKNQGFPFLSLVEHTQFVSQAHFGGDHLVYCGDYLSPNDPLLNQKTAALIQTYLPGIQKINPAYKTSWLKKAWVFKTDYAQPVPGVNHSQLIPTINTPVKGLYLASMAQVYPWDRGTNFAIDLGRRAAKQMLSS